MTAYNVVNTKQENSKATIMWCIQYTAWIECIYYNNYTTYMCEDFRCFQLRCFWLNFSTVYTAMNDILTQNMNFEFMQVWIKNDQWILYFPLLTDYLLRYLHKTTNLCLNLVDTKKKSIQWLLNNKFSQFLIFFSNWAYAFIQYLSSIPIYFPLLMYLSLIWICF